MSCSVIYLADGETCTHTIILARLQATFTSHLRCGFFTCVGGQTISNLTGVSAPRLASTEGLIEPIFKFSKSFTNCYYIRPIFTFCQPISNKKTAFFSDKRVIKF